MWMLWTHGRPSFYRGKRDQRTGLGEDLSSIFAILFVNRIQGRRDEDDVHAGLIQTSCWHVAGHPLKPMIWNELASHIH